jgi:hypothetical protein
MFTRKTGFERGFRSASARDDEQLRDVIGTAEEYLIFKLQQHVICNDLIRNLHGIAPPFLILNSGSLPSGLPQSI